MTLHTEITTTYNGKKYTGLVTELKKFNGRDMVTIMIHDDSRNDGVGYRTFYVENMSQTSENLFA